MKWGRAARGDRVGVPVERQEKEEKTGRSAKYEATCEPKGGEGKGYESPEQDLYVDKWHFSFDDCYLEEQGSCFSCLCNL